MRTGFDTSLIKFDPQPRAVVAEDMKSRFLLGSSQAVTSATLKERPKIQTNLGISSEQPRQNKVYSTVNDLQKITDLSGISINKKYVTSPIDTQRIDDEPDYFKDIDVSVDSGDEYDPLKLPADWDLAKNHAMARRTAPDMAKNSSTVYKCCPCCGFQVEKAEITLWCHPQQLKFLGAGFPLFYNFMKFCILILTIQFSIKGGYNLYTNLQGDFCSQLVNPKSFQTNCPDSFLMRASMANKINNLDAIYRVSQLNLFSLLTILTIFQFFRRSQRHLSIEVDEKTTSPADYTIFVTNIPIGLNVDYHQELKGIFENCAVLNSDEAIYVEKVSLVHDVDEIVEMEQDLEDLVQKKKKTLTKYKFDKSNKVVRLIDKEIKALEHVIHHIMRDYKKTNKNFVGKAFVTFRYPQMKWMVLQSNRFGIIEYIASLFQRGMTPNMNEDELQWNGHKLFIEQAPEPNAVNWEFVHVGQFERFLSRLKSWGYTFGFEAFCYVIVLLISLQIDRDSEQAHNQMLTGKMDSWTSFKITFLCYTISIMIVFVNKFGVGKILHYIVDGEKWSLLTEFQISYAKKFSVCLFLNAAGISYVIDLLYKGNVYGSGGFIYNESLIFCLNAIMGPLIWIIDPWSIVKNYQRNREIEKGAHSLLTQQEANEIMEKPDYLSAKRYADIMKTMWFTFFYGTAIPLGLPLSCTSLICYYWVDKYNLLFRRTVKESISDELSQAMIGMLEYIVLFSAWGEITFATVFLSGPSIYNLILSCISLVYIFILPKDQINKWIFPRVSHEEPRDYRLGRFEFITDYDRENPVTKHEAIKEWNKLLQEEQIVAKGLRQRLQRKKPEQQT